MPEFAYLTPDRVLNIPRTGKKTREYPVRLMRPLIQHYLAAVLNSEQFQKSVELDSRDLSPTIYFFRIKPFVIPAEFVTENPVQLHGFTLVQPAFPALPYTEEK